MMTSSSSERSLCYSEGAIVIFALAFLLLVTAVTVLAIFFSLPVKEKTDVEKVRTKYLDKALWTTAGEPGPLPGVYHLAQFDSHYEKYLLAMDISAQAVPHILAAPETLVIDAVPLGQGGNLNISMQTITNWVTRSIQFSFDSNFTINYGRGENSGVLNNYCIRPVKHVIHCT